MKILIIARKAEDMKTFSKILIPGVFTHAQTDDQALQLLNHSDFDLVIIDVGAFHDMSDELISAIQQRKNKLESQEIPADLSQDDKFFMKWHHMNARQFITIPLYPRNPNDENHPTAVGRDENHSARGGFDLNNAAISISQKHLNFFFHVANIGVGVTNAKGKYEIFNKWWSDTLGYGEEEMKQISYLDITHPDYTEISREYFAKLLRGEISNYRLEKQFIKKDGTPFWADLSVSAIRQEYQTIKAVGIITNITEKKEVEFSMQKQNEQLKELNATKDRFISILAHDLRGPLSQNITFLDFLSSNMKKLSMERIQRSIDSIHQSSQQTYTLLESLLNWSKNKRNLLPFRSERLNLSLLACQVYEMVAENLKNKAIAFSNNIPGDIYVAADQEMLRAIFRNLLTNAAKFSYPEGSVTISAKRQSCMIQIAVSDTGMGMDEKIHRSLFNLGEIQPHRGTQGERGTGFGLLLCKDFVEKHKGAIWVESEPGRGSRFLFTMPMSKA